MPNDIKDILSNDLDWWTQVKQRVNSKSCHVYFRDREIWWAHIGLNIGVEANGKSIKLLRPVLILKKHNQFSFLALPLSTSFIENKYHLSIGIIAGKNATVNMSQLRYMDSKRLAKRICVIDTQIFEDIKRKTREINFSSSS